MKEKIKVFAGLMIAIACILAIDILMMATAINKSDKEDLRHDILLDELYNKVDSLENRIIRLESMMDSDLLDSKESDNISEEASDFNAERVLA